ERQGGDQLGVGGDAPYEVQEFRLRGRRVVGRRGRGGGGVRGEDRHVHRPEERSRRHAAATASTGAAGGAREEREERESTGRATHAARVADEVHVDPPPQVHAGVGHGPEYTTGRPGASTHARHVTPGPVSGPTPDAVSPA